MNFIRFFTRQIQRKPLFSGDSEIDQLYKIFQVMGTPNEQTWAGVSQLPDFGLKFPNWKAQPLPKAITKHQDKHLIDLFKKIMVLDPYKRISAKSAMQHPYFHHIEPITSVNLPLDLLKDL